MKFFLNSPTSALAVALLMAFSCQVFGQLSSSCSSVFVDGAVEAKPQFLDWTYYSSFSGVRNQRFPGKQTLGQPLPENPQGPVSHFYFKNRFSREKEPEISHLETLSGENPNWTSTEDLRNFVYGVYQERGTVPPAWIEALREMDKSTTSAETSFISFTDPNTQELLMAVRIIDSSPTHNLKLVTEAIKIPIEIEFPHLELPERAAGNNDIIEFGRLAKNDEKVEGTLPSLLRALAVYVGQSHYSSPSSLGRKGHEPVVYVEASAVGARYYSRFGFKKVFGPNDVNAPDTYILRIGGDELVQKYYNIDAFYSRK